MPPHETNDTHIYVSKMPVSFDSNPTYRLTVQLINSTGPPMTPVLPRNATRHPLCGYLADHWSVGRFGNDWHESSY